MEACQSAAFPTRIVRWLLADLTVLTALATMPWVVLTGWSFGLPLMLGVLTLILAARLASDPLVARFGDAEMKHELGRRYLHGLGPSRDVGRAIRWYREAAAAGSQTAKFSLAWTLLGSAPQDREEGLTLLRELAEDGVVVAQRTLGELLRRGDQAVRNSEEGVTWLTRAAEAGDQHARASLAYAYAIGDGVEQNLMLAHALWLAAAEQGDATSMENLGEMYSLGLGVSIDRVVALMWYRSALAQGGRLSKASNAYYNALLRELPSDDQKRAETMAAAREWKAASRS